MSLYLAKTEKRKNYWYDKYSFYYSHNIFYWNLFSVKIHIKLWYRFTIIINGLLLMLTFPLMFLVEKTFGFVSPVTLIELSDGNKELLRRLSEEAPGTYQHSIMVSNLASAIAQEIGASALMVRTGALYHDVGKLSNPVFFTENQNGVNPHTRLTPQESARIITGHVEEGIRLTKEAGIPTVLQEFIRTHHGKGMARYFYTTYKNEHKDEDVDEAPFRYKGPNPYTQEQAVLMMADAVEASSRSLQEYTEEKDKKGLIGGISLIAGIVLPMALFYVYRRFLSSQIYSSAGNSSFLDYLSSSDDGYYIVKTVINVLMYVLLLIAPLMIFERKCSEAEIAAAENAQREKYDYNH